MLASDPVATLNQNAGDLGIKIRFGLKSSHSSMRLQILAPDLLHGPRAAVVQHGRQRIFE